MSETELEALADQPDLKQTSVNQYAQEWVTHLKSHNRMLTVLSVVLMLVGIVLAGALIVGYFSQVKLEGELNQSKSHIVALDERLNSEIEHSKSVQAELEQVNQTKTFLEQLKGDTASQLAITNEMVDAQNQKIVMLETEKSMLRAAVQELEASAARKDQRNILLSNQLNSIKSELAQRKTAYQALAKRNKETQEEMNRLAGLVGDQQSEIENIESAYSKRLASIRTLEAKIRKLESERLAVEESKVQAADTSSAYQEITAPPSKRTQAQSVNHHDVASQPIVGTPDKPSSVTTPLSKSVSQPKTSGAPIVDPNQIQVD